MIQTIHSDTLVSLSDAALYQLLNAMRARVEELRTEDVWNGSQSTNLQLIDELLHSSRN